MQQSEFESQDPISESQQNEQIDSTHSDHSHDHSDQDQPQNIEGSISLKDLKDDYEQAQLLMQNGIVPIDLLAKFTKVIEYFSEDPVARLYPDPDYKRFFFGEFLTGVIKKVCTIRDIEVEHQPIVHQFVMCLVEFFGQEIERDNAEMAEAMRWLFNQNSALHMWMFQHNESLYSQEDQQAIIDKLPQEELEWRKALKPGDMVDALKVDDEYNLKMWSKAEITLISDGILYLMFEDDYKSVSSKQVPWYSIDVAPYNLRTKGDEWRKELKPGDFVDAYDSTKAWYQSIIQSKEVVYHDDREIIKYRIGFRMYHPEGNKEDDLGRKYFGWSEKFDEYFCAYSPRIQKFQTFATVIGNSQKDHQSVRYEEQLDDHMDKVLYEELSKRNAAFALPRRRYRSALLVKFLNKFGEIGGFQKILDKINADDNDATTVEIIFYYIDAINASNQMYNRIFMENYLPKLEAAVRKKILNLSPQALRAAKKDRIDNIVQHLIKDLKGRLGLSYQEREQEMSLFNLEVASLFLRQNFLEKRIEGAKFIQEVCKTANLSTFHVNTDSTMDAQNRGSRLSFANEVIEKLKEGKVLYEIFSQERSHFELVQRSDELIKLFILQNSLSQEELEYVWGATKLDETTRLEIFKHFHELSNRLREHEVIFIIDKLSQVPLNKVVMQELDLVHELARRSISADQAYSTQAIDYFWKIGFSNQDNIDKSVVNYSINSISDIIKNWENDQKHVYVERLLSNLANNVEGLLSLKMLKKILQNFTQPIEVIHMNPNQQDIRVIDMLHNTNLQDDGEGGQSAKKQEKSALPPQFKNKNNYICHLEWKYQLLGNFFENFKHYVFRARQSYRDRLLKDPNLALKSVFDQVLCDKFIHSEQIAERLEFLKYVISNSKVEVQIEQLSLLWDELIVHNLSIQDSEMLYRWLREICDSVSKKGDKEDMKGLVEFFQQKLATDSNAFSAISLDGFACLQSFIIFVNEFNEKIVRLFDISAQNYSTNFAHNQDGKELKSYSFNQSSKISQEDYDLEFQINCEPSQIDGIQAVWKIATEANEIRVYERAMAFLVKLYQSVSYGFVCKLPEFDDEFFAKCITMIRRIKDEINGRSEDLKKLYEKDLNNQSISSSILSLARVLPPEERKILRYLTLIKEYIRESERNGTLGVKSHSSLLRGELLDCVQVNSSLGYGKESRKFEMSVQSNMTIHDFKVKIGRLNPEYRANQYIIPTAIVLYRFAGVSTISDADHGKTLADLRFKKNEVLNCYENKYYNNWAVPLLNKDDSDFNSISKKVFIDVFRQFSVEEINESTGEVERFMTRGTCAQFIKSCTEEEIVTEQDNRVENVFETYNNERDEKLKVEEFLQFYLDCCKSKDFVVRENLQTLKIRYNLLRFKADEENQVFTFQQRNSRLEMPRCKLASNSHFFEEIFSLLDSVNEIAQSSWQLIKQLTTKPELYHKIERLNEDPDFSWDQIIDTSSIYKILYTLQIIESMLEDVPETQRVNFEVIQRKSVWIEKFLAVGGFQEIVKLFDTSMSMISKKNVDSLTRFEKNFLEYMLKLVRIFIISAFSASDQSVVQLLDLVKRTSSIKEEVKQENQPAEKENNEQTVGAGDEDLYSTPQKKTSQLVNINKDPIITQELLFGENYAGVSADNVGVEVKEGKNVTGSANNQANSASGLNEGEGDRFSLLAKVMSETSLGDAIISQINFKDLHNELLEIISSMLGKKELTPEDALIMENNLSLWGAITMKNNDLIEEFYKFTRPEDKAGMFGVKNAEQLIMFGLYTYKSLRVREEFANTFAFLAKSVSANRGKRLLIYLLELLQKTFPREDHYYTTRESKQFFDLFNQLIDEYFEVQKNKKSQGTSDDLNESAQNFDMYELLKISITKMKMHQSKESKNSQAEDKTLIGYFTLIQKLIGYISQEDKVMLIAIFNSTDLIKELFYEQLFFDPKSLTTLDNKCKTKESRNACYTLLQKVIESLEPKELAEFISNDLWSILKDLKKPKSWKYVPADNSKQSTSYCGIRNLGNICYMIAMLQQFFMIPQFRYQLLRAEDDSKPDIVNYKGQDIDDNMLRQLQRMFGYLELSEKQEFNPTEFCFSFKDYEGRPTNTAIQADTQEFLNIFFDRLENILKPTSQRHLLDGVFGGNNCSQLICQSCGKVKNIKESFYNLSVPVKDRKGLTNSLAKMIEGSIINDYKCDSCNQKVDVFKRTLIGDTPNVLIVHLQRLVFNFDTFQNDKVNTRFEFPNSLDLSEYSFKNVMQQEGKQIQGADEQEQEYVDRLMQMEQSEFVYKLVGVIIHRGTGQHGHYWSLINTKRGSEELDEQKPEWIHTERDTWREFNDEQVKYFSFNDLKTEAFGGANDISGGADFMDDDMSSYLFNIGGGANSYGKNAYILVYERQKKKDLVVLQKKLVPKQNEGLSLECADTANSRDSQDPQPSLENEDEQTNEQAMEEVVEQVNQPYRKIDAFVPDWIRAEISQDNVIFLMDRYIYCEPFFNFMRSIFKHISGRVVLSQHRYSYDYLPHFVNLK